jgi:hypothetical protein
MRIGTAPWVSASKRGAEQAVDGDEDDAVLLALLQLVERLAEHGVGERLVERLVRQEPVDGGVRGVDVGPVAGRQVGVFLGLLRVLESVVRVEEFAVTRPGRG